MKMFFGFFILFVLSVLVAAGVLIALAVDEAKRDGKLNPVRESLLKLEAEWQKLKTTIKNQLRGKREKEK